MAELQTGQGKKAASTVQGAMTGFVVYVVPTKMPPHVPTTVAKNPALGVTVKGTTTPQFTVCGVGRLIVPFNPALGVTVYVLSGKVALHVELATKLNVLVAAAPAQTPAQPPNVEPWSGVAVSVMEVSVVSGLIESERLESQ